MKAEAERERQATLSVHQSGADIGTVMSMDGPDSVSALGHKDYGGILTTCGTRRYHANWARYQDRRDTPQSYRREGCQNLE